MHGAAEFLLKFQLLQTNLITDLLFVHLMSRNQKIDCVCWIEPIHNTGGVVFHPAK
jgi:hypothetical protein